MEKAIQILNKKIRHAHFSTKNATSTVKSDTASFSTVQDEVIPFGNIPCIIDQNAALSMDYNIIK